MASVQHGGTFRKCQQKVVSDLMAHPVSRFFFFFPTQTRSEAANKTAPDFHGRTKEPKHVQVTPSSLSPSDISLRLSPATLDSQLRRPPALWRARSVSLSLPLSLPLPPSLYLSLSLSLPLPQKLKRNWACEVERELAGEGHRHEVYRVCQPLLSAKETGRELHFLTCGGSSHHDLGRF